MRLQRFLAEAGVASRRKCGALILQGRVAVNGVTDRDPSTPVAPGTDRITVDGVSVGSPEPRVYLILHKPRGVVSTASDERGRMNVVEWVRRRGGPPARLFPVGRLDMESEGLMLLTNDGPLAFSLTHPSRQIPKRYRVWVDGPVDAESTGALQGGVMLEEGFAAPAHLRVVRRGRSSGVLDISLLEGKKREIRRMCETAGLSVRRLVRTHLGPLKLGRLPPGQWRTLSAAEVAELKRWVERAETRVRALHLPDGHGSILPNHTGYGQGAGRQGGRRAGR